MLPPAYTPSLTAVKPRVSCVVPYPVEICWSAIRRFDSLAWFLRDLEGQSVRADPVQSQGTNPFSIGALRMVSIGDSRLFERLVCLDDEDHTLKYRLISHPESVNPFPASFVNYLSTMQLQSITVGEHTFIEWKCEFYTEHEFAEGMKQTFETMYETGISGLQEYLARQQLQQLQPPPSPVLHRGLTNSGESNGP